MPKPMAPRHLSPEAEAAAVGVGINLGTDFKAALFELGLQYNLGLERTLLIPPLIRGVAFVLINRAETGLEEGQKSVFDHLTTTIADSVLALLGLSKI